jgi:LemA protein
MSLIGLLALVIIGVVVFVWFQYNQFVTIRTRIKASIQEIGNQLKRQSNLIPNLTSSVKGYMKHEKAVFDKLTEARKAVASAVKSGSSQKMVDASEKMQSALGPIRVVFESTPELQAAKPVVKLMDELRDTADKVMYSRRTLIDLTADFNVKVVSFPSNLIATIFKFKKEVGLKVAEAGEHLEVKKEETKTPKVEL